MRFSLKKLESYFPSPLPPANEVAAALTDHAFEIDELTATDGDWELEVKILPDRAADAKNDLGLARELSAVLDQALKPEYQSLPTPETARIKIDFTVNQIIDLIGETLNETEIIDYLKRARVVVERNTSNRLTALIPAERLDLNIKEDLADEVARLYGYANVKIRQLSPVEVQPEHHPDFILANQLRQFFIERGFTEIYGYTFQPTGEVVVEKPLAADKAFLRINLSTGLQNCLKNNLKLALFTDQSIKLFELGSVFPSLVGEEKRLGFGFGGGDLRQNQVTVEQITAELLGQFSVPTNQLTNSQDDNLLVAEVTLSELKPSGSHDYLLTSIAPQINYRPFSTYPRIIRDIALWVPMATKPDEVAQIINQTAGPLLVDQPIFSNLFSLPAGRQAKGEKKSLAFRLIFQSFERTLTDEEANKELEKITQALTSQGWESR